MHLFIARLRAGTVGEIQRVVHQFTVPDDLGKPPAEVTAFCGESFEPTKLELLTHISGMPCEACLAVAPKPAELESSQDFMVAVKRAADYLEWWLPQNSHIAGSEAAESIKVLMSAAHALLDTTE